MVCHPTHDGSLDLALSQGQLGRVTSARLHHLLPHVQQSFLRLGSAQRAEVLVKLCREAAQRREPVIVFRWETNGGSLSLSLPCVKVETVARPPRRVDV